MAISLTFIRNILKKKLIKYKNKEVVATLAATHATLVVVVSMPAVVVVSALIVWNPTDKENSGKIYTPKDNHNNSTISSEMNKKKV